MQKNRSQNPELHVVLTLSGSELGEEGNGFGSVESKSSASVSIIGESSLSIIGGEILRERIGRVTNWFINVMNLGLSIVTVLFSLLFLVKNFPISSE